jgi:hypothetical protein
MALNVSIEGLRFRKSDGKLKVADQLRILGQRLSNPAVIRFREGDNPADLTRIVAQRPPINLQFNEAVAVSAIKTERPGMIDDSRLPFKVAIGVIPGSLLKGRKIAAEINEQNPGSRIRIPTEAELLKLNKLLEDLLEGTGDWIWTETEQKGYSGQFVLLRQDDLHRDYSKPGNDNFSCAIRFIENR